MSALKINTTIYVKMEIPNPLLLSQAVCGQLGIVQYHPNVKPLDAEKSETAKQTQKNKFKPFDFRHSTQQ